MAPKQVAKSKAAQASGSTSSSGAFRWDASWQRHRPEGDRLHVTMMSACLQNDFEKLKEILKKPRNPDDRNQFESTPLFVASGIRLIGVSWNQAGSGYNLLCGTFAFAAVQEAADAEAELLRARGMNVVVGDGSSVLVAKSAFTTGPGDLVRQLLKGTEHNWEISLRSCGFFSTFGGALAP